MAETRINGLPGCVIGSVASFIYFWGLWVTVHRLRDALNPVGLYATSLVLRLGILGIAMAFVLNGDWRQVGFRGDRLPRRPHCDCSRMGAYTRGGERAE